MNRELIGQGGSREAEIAAHLVVKQRHSGRAHDVQLRIRVKLDE